MKVILCIGETAEQYEDEETREVITLIIFICTTTLHLSSLTDYIGSIIIHYIGMRGAVDGRTGGCVWRQHGQSGDCM